MWSRARSVGVREPLSNALLAAFGYACVVHAVNTASKLTLPRGITSADLFLAVGTAIVIAAARGSTAGEPRRTPVGLVPAEQQAGPRSGA